MVEFALVATMAFFLLFGVVTVGLAVVENTSISNGAREGARAGSIAGTSDATVATRARAAVISYGAVPTVIITNYTVNSATPVAAQTPVVKAVGTRAAGDLIQVQVTHTFNPIAFVPWGRGIPLSSRAVMGVE
jgi:Flp pilus assembly protein TadG